MCGPSAVAGGTYPRTGDNDPRFVFGYITCSRRPGTSQCGLEKVGAAPVVPVPSTGNTRSSDVCMKGF